MIRMELLNVFLGAGALGTLVSIVGMLINRRNTKSEANARDLKNPAEVDNLVATTHRANLESVLTVNKELREDNKQLRDDNEGLRGRLERVEETQRTQGDEQAELRDLVQILQRGLASAYAYITTLLQLIEEHLPNITIPTPPKGYRESTQTKESTHNG